MAFALKLRKKHGKTSFRVADKRQETCIKHKDLSESKFVPVYATEAYG